MTKQMQQNLIALAMAFIALIFVYYKMLMNPLEKKYADNVKKLEQTEKKLAEMKRRALELPKLQAEMELLEHEVAELGKSLPKDKEIPDLLKTVTKTAQRFGLKISNFSPSGVTAQPNYNEVLFGMNMTGSFHSLAHFLAELGQESRILNIRNITCAAIAAAKGGSETISLNLTLVAFTFKG